MSAPAEIRYLLDTNVLSELQKPAPSPAVVSWVTAQRMTSLYIASLTLAELQRGVLDKPNGARRRALERWLHGPQGPTALFAGRILPFDERAALVWGRLMADGRETGRTRSALDMIIAAVAQVHDCTIVTLNTKDFGGLNVLNPASRV